MAGQFGGNEQILQLAAAIDVLVIELHAKLVARAGHGDAVLGQIGRREERGKRPERLLARQRGLQASGRCGRLSRRWPFVLAKEGRQRADVADQLLDVGVRPQRQRDGPGVALVAFPGAPLDPDLKVDVRGRLGTARGQGHGRFRNASGWPAFGRRPRDLDGVRCCGSILARGRSGGLPLGDQHDAVGKVLAALLAPALLGQRLFDRLLLGYCPGRKFLLALALLTVLIAEQRLGRRGPHPLEQRLVGFVLPQAHDVRGLLLAPPVVVDPTLRYQSLVPFRAETLSGRSWGGGFCLRACSISFLIVASLLSAHCSRRRSCSLQLLRPAFQTSRPRSQSWLRRAIARQRLPAQKTGRVAPDTIGARYSRATYRCHIG